MAPCELLDRHINMLFMLWISASSLEEAIMRKGMHIGELAARFGLNPKTIRYYERIHLLPPADRTDTGYRWYDAQDIARVGFIRRAKLLGLSLDEIRDLLSLTECGERPCRQVLGLIEVKIHKVDQQIQELQEFRTELVHLRSLWSDRDGDFQAETSERLCPIIEEQTAVTEHPELAQILEPVARHRSR